MSDIAPAHVKIQQESVDFRSPVSESALTTIGGTANYCLDHIDSAESNIATQTARINSVNSLAITRIDQQIPTTGFTSGTATVVSTPGNRYFHGQFRISADAAVFGNGGVVTVVNAGTTTTLDVQFWVDFPSGFNSSGWFSLYNGPADPDITIAITPPSSGTVTVTYAGARHFTYSPSI